MKSQNYTVLLPIIREACGDLAEDLDQVIESVDTSFASLLKRSSQSELSRKPSVLGPGFSAPPGKLQSQDPLLFLLFFVLLIGVYCVAGGPDYLNRTVMSYHYYCWALGYAGAEETDPVLSTLCDEVSSKSLNDHLVGYRTSDSASSSKFRHLALLVALVSHSYTGPCLPCLWH